MRDLGGKNILVLGMADSGSSAVEFLVQRGARVTACDKKPLKDLGPLGGKLSALGVPFVEQSETSMTGRDLVVVSPGVPWDRPELRAARAAGVETVGDVEMASWFLKGPIAAITGSVGKTTTTTLVGRMLDRSRVPCQVGGNIGRPVSEMVATSRPDQWNVLEISSFQLEASKTFHVSIGLALNLTDNHLDRHHTMPEYAAAKGKLFATQTAQDTAVLNADNEWTRAYADSTPAAKVWFSVAHPLASGWWLDEGRLVANGKPFLNVDEIRVRGRHNYANILAAAAVSHLAGASFEAIAQVAREFRGVEHRLEYVRTISGVDYFNDSKATTVESVLAALDSFEGGLWVILGGKDKGSDFRPLREPLRAKAKGIFLIGTASEKIASQVELPAEPCGVLDKAVRQAASRATPGDVVLLAPACTSWDQYNNFEERGRHFKDLVARLEASA